MKKKGISPAPTPWMVILFISTYMAAYGVRTGELEPAITFGTIALLSSIMALWGMVAREKARARARQPWPPPPPEN